MKQQVTLTPLAKMPSVLPDSTVVENEFGSLTSYATVSPEGLHIEQTMAIKRSLQPREKYSELLALIGKDSKATIPAVVLKPAKQ